MKKHESEHDAIQTMLALYAADALNLESGDASTSTRVTARSAPRAACMGRLCERSDAMPQPMPPQGLMERTRMRIVQQREAAAVRRRENLMLAVLVVLGWAVSLATWTVMRAVVGGSLVVLGANMVSGVSWFLLSTVFVWMTAAKPPRQCWGRTRRRKEDV